MAGTLHKHIWQGLKTPYDTIFTIQITFFLNTRKCQGMRPPVSIVNSRENFKAFRTRVKINWNYRTRLQTKQPICNWHNAENTINYSTLYNNSNNIQTIVYSTRNQQFFKRCCLMTLLVLWLCTEVLQEPTAFNFNVRGTHIYTTTEHRIPEDSLLLLDCLQKLKSHRILSAALRNYEASQLNPNATLRLSQSTNSTTGRELDTKESIISYCRATHQHPSCCHKWTS
jgi:hypothetical protein